MKLSSELSKEEIFKHYNNNEFEIYFEGDETIEKNSEGKIWYEGKNQWEKIRMVKAIKNIQSNSTFKVEQSLAIHSL